MARTSKAQEEKDFKDQIRQEAAKTAKTVLKKATIYPDFTEDDPDLDDDLDDALDLSVSDNETRPASDRFSILKKDTVDETANGDDVDIFDRFNHCQDFPVNYTIQRNGELLAKKDAPYSWEEVQAEFGKGMYKIIAKNALNGRILKHESKSVAAPKTTKEKESEKLASERESVKDILSTVNSQFNESLHALKSQSQQQVEILMKQMELEKEERRRLEEKQQEELKELRRMSKDAESSTTTLLSTLLPLLVKKDDGNSTMSMIMEMQKMNMENMKELQRQMLELQKEAREEARRMQEATNQMIRSIVEEVKPKETKPEFGALEIMKMMQEAESKGMEKMQTFMELADERAERRLEELRADEKDGKEEDSILKSTLKMLVPVLVQQGMTKSMTPSAPVAAPEQRLIQHHRPASPVLPPSQPIKKNVTTPRPTDVKAQARPAVTPAVKPVATPAQVRPVQVTKVNTSQNAPVVEKTPKASTISVEQAKEFIIQTATPIIGEAFQNYLATQSFDAKGTAQKTAQALNQNGISVEYATQIVTVNDILDLCHKFGIDTPETDNYLRLYYENLQACITA